MSPPSTAPTKRKSSIVEWFVSRTNQLAEELTEQHLAAHPEMLQRFGTRARRKCLEDALYHIHFLREAVAAGSTELFVSYIRWAKVMLVARGISETDLAQNLQQLRMVLERRARKADKQKVLAVIDAAIAALPAAPSKLPSVIRSDRPYAELANSYIEHLLLLQRETAVAEINRYLDTGLTISALFQYVIVPAQHEIGRRWQQNEINVLQEHYCTASTEVLLAQLQKRFVGQPRRLAALTLCAEGEQHCIGIKMFSELLEADGWTVRYIGANSPLRDTLRFMQDSLPELVALSASTALSLSSTRELIEAIRAMSTKPVRILVGGPAVADPQVCASLKADGCADSLVRGLDLANSWFR